MGQLFLVSLPATGAVIYRCKYCDTHLAYGTDIISRMFCCKSGKAYLFGKMVNVNFGEKEDRQMTTGPHTVCDILCVACGSVLGWKYLVAFEKSQRYKEGKFILDRSQALGTPVGHGTTQLWPQQQQHTSGDDQSDDDSSDQSM